MRPSRWRRRRWAALIGIGLVLLFGGAFAVLRIKFEGPDLGDKVASILNKTMRGRIEIGSIEWPTSALQKVVTGGWVQVTVRDVKVWDDCVLSTNISEDDADALRTGDPNEDCTPDDRPDPDPRSKRRPRKLLLSTPEITAELDVHAAMFGSHDLVVRHLVVHGGEALIEQTREPYPLHAYDRTIVSIITAFYPRMAAGFRVGVYGAKPPPVFDLRDIHVEHLNLTAHFAPSANPDGTVEYGVAARLEDVNIDATQDAKLAAEDHTYLYMDAADTLVPKFYVRLAAHAKHGKLRILDEGPRMAFSIPGTRGLGDAWGAGRKAYYEIELASVDVDRLAQLPVDWTHGNDVANTLEVDATIRTLPCATEGGPTPAAKDGAELRLTGQLLNWWDRPYDGKWDFKLELKNFGPTLRTCIKSTMGGDDLAGEVHITGPYIADPKISLDLHGLDFDVPLSSTEEPIRLTLAEVHGAIDLVNEQGWIEQTKAQVRGGKEPGEVMVKANFGLKPPTTNADINITQPIDVGRFLPPKVASAAGHYLKGTLKVAGDTEEGFEISDFDLRLGVTPNAGDYRLRLTGGRLYSQQDFDLIKLEHIKFTAGRSEATINGKVVYKEQKKCPAGEKPPCMAYEYENVELEGDIVDLDVWLKRFGLPVFATSMGGGGGPGGVAIVLASSGGGGGSGSSSASSKTKIIINGPITAPTINAQATFQGIPCIGSVRITESTLQPATGYVEVSFTSGGLGGSVSGRAVVDTSGAVTVLRSLKINGSHLDGSRLCGAGNLLKGTIDKVDLTMNNVSVDPNRPPLEWLAYAQATVSAHKLEISGDNYSDVALCVNQKDDAACRPNLGRARLDVDDLTNCEVGKSNSKTGGFCAVATARRDSGGAVDATVINLPGEKSGRTKLPSRLDGTVAVDSLPLGVLGTDKVGGFLNAAFHLQGSIDAPQAVGNIDLLRAWALGAFIGDFRPVVSATEVAGIPGVKIEGNALSGNLGVDLEIGTKAPFPVHVALTTRRLELDPFVDLQKKLNFPEPIQAWMTGVITARTELKPLNGKPAVPDGWVEIEEMEALVDHRTPDGRNMPLRFSLVEPTEAGRNAMSLHVTPTTVDLACRDPKAPNGMAPCPAQLATPAGIVSIEGSVTQNQMSLHATGDLFLHRLAPLLENTFESVGGKMVLDARFKGTLDKPSYEVGLALDQVSLRPIGTETDLQATEGLVKVADGTLGFTGVKLRAKDKRRDEQGELEIGGTIGLQGLKPASWGLLVSGKIAGKMIAALAPSVISEASGMARIDGALTLSGKGELPLVGGTLTFDPEEGAARTPLVFTPRDYHHELAMLGGSIEIETAANGPHRTYTFRIEDNPLTASIDGVGTIKNIQGNLSLVDGVPDKAHVELDADNYPYRSADRRLDLVIGARNITLDLPSAHSGLRARGEVSIINGVYRQSFELTDVLKPAPATAASVPFWDAHPMIGDINLDLSLNIGRFSVDTNIAKIELEGHSIEISGSPRDPRLSGAINVSRGEFKFPGTRAKFTRTNGRIDFSPTDRADNPRLEITSEAPDYVDLSGQQHAITLTLNGPLNNIGWDLRTSTGLNKSQTTNLLLLGRDPEQLRRSLGDQSIGSDPNVVQQGSTLPQGPLDTLVKDVAGDWVSGLLGSSLTRLTHLDVLRFEVNFNSVGVHGETRVLENVKAVGEYELTSRGSTANLHGDITTPYHASPGNDSFSIQGAYLDKNFNDPAEVDLTDMQFKLVYRLYIP